MMPTSRLLWLTLAAGLPYALTPFAPDFTAVGHALTMLLAAVAVLDLLFSPRLDRVEAYRESAEVLSVGARNPVVVTLRNRNQRPITLEVHDEPPQPGSWEGLPFQVEMPLQQRMAVTYFVRPHSRGVNNFGMLFLRMRTRLGLWQLQADRDLQQTVKVYPDIQAIRQVELLARQNRLAEAGVRLSRLRGRGSEFDRLREYRREDEYRNIDWKATARHRELISREYVVERNQNLLIVLDSGRSMCNTHEGVSHFDRAMNAAMLLTYVALRQGDTVGLLAGDRQVRRWVQPIRGQGGVERLTSQIFDLEPRYEATDYDLLASELRRRYRKRSLVIWMTHVIDELHLEMLTRSVRRLRSPHLVLMAFLHNVPLQQRAKAVPATDLEAFQIASAVELMESQRVQMISVQKTGLLTIDCLPEDLSSRLISQYLEIKARHLL